MSVSFSFIITKPVIPNFHGTGEGEVGIIGEVLSNKT